MKREGSSRVVERQWMMQSYREMKVKNDEHDYCSANNLPVGIVVHIVPVRAVVVMSHGPICIVRMTGDSEYGLHRVVAAGKIVASRCGYKAAMAELNGAIRRYGGKVKHSGRPPRKP